MKIGIPFQASSTAFGSGKAQAVLAMANVCVKAGHDVTLLYEGDRSWWEDVQGLEAQYTIRPLTKERLCDLVIDIDGKLDPDLRTAVGGRVIVFFVLHFHRQVSVWATNGYKTGLDLVLVEIKIEQLQHR